MIDTAIIIYSKLLVVTDSHNQLFLRNILMPVVGLTPQQLKIRDNFMVGK